MFFSVKIPMSIGDKPYIPCVCYPLSKALEATVSRLVTEGKANIYTERKFFCNGKLVEKKKKSKKFTVKKEENILVPPAEEAIEEGF